MPIIPNPYIIHSQQSPSQRMNLDRNIQDTFNTINAVRASPSLFLNKYQQELPSYNGKIYKDKVKTREGATALNDLLSDLSSRQAIPQPLKWSFGLHMVADEQARSLAQCGLATTEGTSSHRGLAQRLQEYAVVKGKVSSVCEFGAESGDEIVRWLLVDDGLTSRKRRNTILNPTFKYVGIGTALHSQYGVVTVIILAEDVISLVAPGREGQYIKREPVQQGQVRTFKIEHRKLNERDTYAKSYRPAATINKVLSARSTYVAQERRGMENAE